MGSSGRETCALVPFWALGYSVFTSPPDPRRGLNQDRPCHPYSTDWVPLADEVVTGGNGDGAGHFARTRGRGEEVAPGRRRAGASGHHSFSAVTFTGLTVITGRSRLRPGVPGLA